MTSPAALAVAGAGVGTAQQNSCVTVAATQFACSSDVEANLRKAEHLVRDAAGRGANIILLQELFASPYFPIEQRDYFAWAIELDEDKGYIQRFQTLARELNVVLPLSFYERCNNAHFNSVLCIDADGSQLGIYRKSHIPDGPGYQEKYYFSPGNSGFKVFNTRFCKIGVGICWDQWFPEAARCLAIDGAELILYPTAIGSEPQSPAMDTCGHWQRTMQGHAAANMVPVVASNRIGKEVGKDSDISITFYGSSFMTDHTGQIVADAGRHQETILVNTYNLNELKGARRGWGVFRDRRPDLYGKLSTFDGQSNDRRQPYTAPFPPPTQNQYVRNAAAAAAAAVGMQNSNVVANLAVMQVPNCKKVDNDALMPGMMALDSDTRQRLTTNGFDLHEATFIGEVKLSAQRRPRGRCWVCRNKTTYECKVCQPGPVPLCNRTARDCWWKYHAGEISPYVPNKRGRKRRKDTETQPVNPHQQMEQVGQVAPVPQVGQVPQVPGVPQVPPRVPQVQQVQDVSQVGATHPQQTLHPQSHHEQESVAAELNGDDVDSVKAAAAQVGVVGPTTDSPDQVALL